MVLPMTSDNKTNNTTRRAVEAVEFPTGWADYDENEICRSCGKEGQSCGCPLGWPSMETAIIERYDYWKLLITDALALDKLEEFTRPVTAAPTSKQPAILTRDDGESLVYASKVSSLYGEPSGGKSWLGLMIAIEAIKKGGRAVWWDAEDKAQTVHQRALVLGGVKEVTDPNFMYLEPSVVDDKDAFDAAIQWIGRGGPFSVVVVDAVESHGCPSDGSPINEWWESHVKPWRSTDCAVVLLDHVPKRRQDRPKGGIGSVHKCRDWTGAGIRISGNPWTKRESGALNLYPQKDRHGDIPGNPTTPAAVIVGDYWALPDGESAFKVAIEAPKATGGDTLEIRVLEALGEHGPVTGQNELRP